MAASPKKGKTTKSVKQKTERPSVRSKTSQARQQATHDSFAQQRMPDDDLNVSPEFIEDIKFAGLNSSLSIDISAEFERIEKYFYSIPPEFYRPITARCVLRIFPLANADVFAYAMSLKNADPVYETMLLWRAVLMLWHDSTDISRSKQAVSAVEYLSERTMSPSTAIHAIVLASQLLLGEASEDQMKPAILACETSINAISDSDLTREQDVLMALEMVMRDISWLREKAKNSAEINAVPLWHDETFEESDWRNGLAQRLDESADRSLDRIKHAYHAMLTGKWGGQLTPKTIIKGSAELRPQDDKPAINDSLGREALVRALVPRLSDAGDQSHLTIGLLGNWGIGKTSVLRQLQAALDKDIHNQYLFGEFNAWSYEHTGNVQAGLAHEVISALTSANPRWSQLHRWFHKPWVILQYSIKLHGKKLLLIAALIFIALNSGLIEKIPTLNETSRVILGGGTLAALWLLFTQLKSLLSQPLAKELKTYLRLPSAKQYLGTIPEMKKNIKDLCEICLGHGWWGKNRRLIFFIDDLDRCDVDGIVKTFEAIRLVLDRDWVTVVIAMDQRIALPALACNYEKLSRFHDHRDPMSIARDYLGKVIHLPIRLDDPDDLAVAQYLAKIWDDKEFFQQISDEIYIVEELGKRLAASDKAAKTKKTVQKPEGTAQTLEPIEDIIEDILKIDVESVFKDDEKVQVEENQIDGFGQEQKEAFYRWLIRFNLRNPRQIKRLYNSFNLLWSIYDSSWKQQDDQAWYPNMLGLLVLEKINEQLPFATDEDYREPLRQLMFKDTRWKKIMPTALVEEVDLKVARKEIQQYQKQFEIDLLKRLKPFVLPGVRPEQNRSGS